MRFKLLLMSILVAALILPENPAFAQRGGRGGGGGGMQRGGGPGNPQAGGFGGGFSNRGAQAGMQGGGGSNRGAQAGMQGGNPSMGPFGQGPSSRPGLNSGAGGSSRPGPGAGATPGVGGGARPGAAGSGGEGRPGLGAGGANQPGTRPGFGTGETSRPGIGTGESNRPGLNGEGARQPGVGFGEQRTDRASDSTRPGLTSRGDGEGVGVLPGAGAGRPGIGAGGVGGPQSGVGVLPGAGAGRAGVDRRAGSYYVGNSALVGQRDAVVAGWYATPAYNPALYAGAWQANTMTSPSIYVNPGYGALAATAGIAAQPAPYDYGGNVVSHPEGVYVNGDPVGSPQQYAEQAGQLAQAGAAEPDPNTSWQPIGVFAMLDDGQTNPVDLFQLAINSQGLIRGNYHNMTTDETVPLAGSVDPNSQRAAWTIGGDQVPVYEVGLANLTADQTTMLVHSPDGQQLQFNLIRLPDPSPPGATP